MEDDREFQKKVALYQMFFTLFVTVGSIFIGMGISLLIFSMDLSFSSIDKKGEIYQIIQQISSFADFRAYVLIVIGLCLLLGGFLVFWYKTDKLK